MKFPCKIVLAGTGWSMRYPYNFAPWFDLNQLSEGQFFDIIGRVMEGPSRDVNSTFPKSRVTLRWGDFT